jgi:signal transduction histidine kinase
VTGARAAGVLGDNGAEGEPLLAVSCATDDEASVRSALGKIVHESDFADADPIEVEVDAYSASVVPLRAHLARAGTLVVLFDRSPAHPDVEERELLAAFADQAGLALDRAQAVADREELAVISDRERIARDLHDVVIQRLFATGLQLQGLASVARDEELAQRLDLTVDELDVTIKAIRGTIFELQHRQAHSLRAEIRAIVREYVPALGFAPAVLTSGPIDTAVSAEVREQLLPVLREAVSNMARHSLAEQAHISVDVTDDELCLTVTDGGVGLPADRRESGLGNARRRADQLGGSMDLRTPEHGGTSLVWRVPLRSRSQG